MIKITDLHKSFGDQAVLKGVNLEIETGQTLALIGGSGKGKSVLLKHIIGLAKPDAGQIFIDQQDIAHLRGAALKRLKDRLGIVFQFGALFDSLTVYENIAFVLKEKTKLSTAQIKERVFKELENVALQHAEINGYFFMTCGKEVRLYFGPFTPDYFTNINDFLTAVRVGFIQIYIFQYFGKCVGECLFLFM